MFVLDEKTVHLLLLIITIHVCRGQFTFQNCHSVLWLSKIKDYILSQRASWLKKNQTNLAYSEQMSSLFKIFDSRQAVEHALQSSTLRHDSCHLVHLLIILLLICNKVR